MRGGGSAGQSTRGRIRLTSRGFTGIGFQPAIVRAHSRACALSVTPGNNRRSSTAADNSPPLEGGADRGGLCLGHNEHAESMGRRTAIDNAPLERRDSVLQVARPPHQFAACCEEPTEPRTLEMPKPASGKAGSRTSSRSWGKLMT